MLTALSIQAAYAQQLQASLSHYSTDDGLASNSIAYIKQDDLGYLWIATWNGLSRFDGYNFYNYRTGNASHIKNLHNRILDLAVDQSQNIWMRMYDGRVFVMQRSIDQIINPFDGMAGNEEFRADSPIIVTSGGEVIIAIKGAGLYIMRLDHNGLKTEQATTGGLTITDMAEGYRSDIWLATNDGIHRLDRRNLTIEKRGILQGHSIMAMTSNGYNIYAATDQGAIYSFAYGQEPIQIRQPSGSKIFSLFVDSHTLVWFCDTRMGAVKLDPKTGSERLYQQTVLVPEHDGNGGMFNETNGTVWIRMNHGGYGYYNRETDEVEYFHNDPSNPWNLSNTVNASAELPEGVVWMSTSRRGLEKLEILKNTISRVRMVPDATSTTENETRAMFYDKQRRLLLIGNKHNCLFVYKQGGGVDTYTTDDRGESIGRIYGITKDRKGNYWLCSKDKGLFKMSQKAGGGFTLHNYCHDDNNKYSLNSNSAYIPVEDRQGNIWVATYGGGVNVLTKNKSGQEVFLNCDNEMANYPQNSFRKIRTVEMDKDGNIWAGSTDGILIMSLDKNRLPVIKKLENASDGEHILMCNDVVCITRDREGSMWVGTNGGGLSHTIDKDDSGNWMFETFTAKDGLPSEEIHSITFDERGNAWFATDHILCSFDVKKHVLTTFSGLDGVDETICSEGAAIMGPGGNILIGTLDGYYLVDRKKLMTSTGSLLKLRLTDFYIDDVMQTPRSTKTYDYYVPESKRVELPKQSSKFAFRFAALNYSLQHRVQYQYMLEGYDDEWHTADKDLMATYENVPRGTYTLKVKAFLQESPNNYDMRTIEVVVPAPFYLSSTAIWIYLILLAIAALYFFYHRQKTLSSREQQRHPERQDSSEEEKSEETTDDFEVIED